MIESDPCCFQVTIACEPEKSEDEDCRGNIINEVNSKITIPKVEHIEWRGIGGRGPGRIGVGGRRRDSKGGGNWE